MKTRTRSLVRALNLLLYAGAAIALDSLAWGNTEYYRHVIFDNSLTSDAYFYSQGLANGSSTLELKNGHLPVETNTFLTPPNSLRLNWQSQADGGWEAEVHVNEYRNRFPQFEGHNLYFWCFAPQRIAASDLPVLVLSNTAPGLHVAEFPGAFTEPLPLGIFTGDIPAGKWIQVRIPLSKFHTSSIYEFDPQYIRSVVFHQGHPDGAPHVLILDEIRLGDDPARAQPASLPTPQNVSAIGYDRHVEVRWDAVNNPAWDATYSIVRSMAATSNR